MAAIPDHSRGDTAPSTSMRIVRGAALAAAPWKNGGGVTREVAVHPPGAGFDNFVWRVSVADVERSGPFSRFAGVDRTLVLLAGAGMQIADARGMAQTSLTAPFAFVQFPGELAIDAALVDGPTRDLNIMLRRGLATSAVELWHGPGEHRLDADTVLVFCAEGPIELTDGEGAFVRLDTMDTLRVDGARAWHCTVTGGGSAVAIGIRGAC
ncbi:HutD family protein [Trinickia caryophylli]|nr:HutD family protein [Trinickia caryophylli]WQE11310.1 HutD family protein [Trinickia caryophylli]GLU32461.1 hypothetical protein Busp01_23030 [Trinickia caryophylli]